MSNYHVRWLVANKTKREEAWPQRTHLAHLAVLERGIEGAPLDGARRALEPVDGAW